MARSLKVCYWFFTPWFFRPSQPYIFERKKHNWWIKTSSVWTFSSYLVHGKKKTRNAKQLLLKLLQYIETICTSGLGVHMIPKNFTHKWLIPYVENLFFFGSVNIYRVSRICTRIFTGVVGDVETNKILYGKDEGGSKMQVGVIGKILFSRLVEEKNSSGLLFRTNCCRADL